MKKIKGLLVMALLLGATGMATKVEADANGAPYVVRVSIKENAWCTYRVTYYSNGDVVRTLISCISGSGDPNQ